MSINIGGFGQDVIEPLNDEFKQILDSSKRGVVVVSFGTIARSSKMPPETKRAFLDAFSDYPDVTFLWKYESPEDDVAKDYPNVRTAKWLPQAALLNHTKTIGLLMHGGMNTIAESAAYGVPMVCVALFADQTRNSRMLEERGIGIGVSKHQLTREVISAALDKILNDKSYYQNAKQLSKIISAKPETANQRVLRYTEFAAKFDIAQRLSLEGSRLSVIQYYNLDVFFTVFLIAFVSLWISFKVSKFLIRLICCRRKSVKKAEKVD